MKRYHMQKAEREITDREKIRGILREGKYATVALCRDNEPYVVTLSYGYDEKKNALYFHTALKGLKLRVIRNNQRGCGTVIEDRGYRMGRCSHAYRSVVFWGSMHVIEDRSEKKHAMDILFEHLEENPAPIKGRTLSKEEAYDNLGVLRFDIEEITGKQGQ